MPRLTKELVLKIKKYCDIHTTSCTDCQYNAECKCLIDASPENWGLSTNQDMNLAWVMRDLDPDYDMKELIREVRDAEDNNKL